jgi:hypothetical protein
MNPSAPQHPAPLRRSRRLALVAITVLVGLFLMHGMSASADSACGNEPASATASASSHLPATPTVTVDGAHSASDAASIKRCACTDAMAASCVPLSQRSTNTLLTALLLALAWVSTPRPSPTGGVLSAARRARRTSTGTTLLALTCICRT